MGTFRAIGDGIRAVAGNPATSALRLERDRQLSQRDGRMNGHDAKGGPDDERDSNRLGSAAPRMG
jgi:hypothetical protein